MESKNKKTGVRQKANMIKEFRCKNLIAVIENPFDIKNIGTIVRNVNAFGVDKTYIIDPKNSLPDDWQDMREAKNLSKTSVSAIKWSFVKRFKSSEDCIDHLESNRFVSYITSPHIKGKENCQLDKIDFSEDYKLAIWFGNERHGISDIAIEHAKLCINIPMFGMIESLNLGTSSGIVLYEAAKQRREYQSKYKKRNKRVPRVQDN